MGAKTKKSDAKKRGMDVTKFLEAIKEMEEKKGIPSEKTIQALKEAIEGALKSKNYEDMMIQTNIYADKGIIEVYEKHHIVDDVKDDVLEISKEDADAKIKEVPGTFVDGNNDLNVPVSMDNFTTMQAKKCQSIFIQKIREIEKAIIYEAYSNKVGENVTVTVEKCEDRFVIINLGKTTITMDNKQLIGRETFRVGEQIRVYLSKVDSSSQGPQIVVSRSDPNFLKRLFEEENREVYDGTVVIKNIAREAGERSKVSVEATDPNVDPVGACIGQGGSKIQKICNQINREKIDIVQYHVHPGLFVAEALKPAQVLGVKLEDGNEKKAIAIVKDGELKVAIGRQGVNVRLASQLTSYHIDILEESSALEKNVDYVSIDRMREEEEAMIYEMRRQKILEEHERQEQERLRKMKEVEAPKVQKEEEKVKEEKVSTPVEETKEEEVVEKTEEEVVLEKKEEEEKVEYNPVVMGKRVSLEELERQIEEEKKKPTTQASSHKKKEQEEEKKEKEEEKVVDRSNYMDIYTDEELKELEEEEEENDSYDDSDDDYEDYDEYDDYYED